MPKHLSEQYSQKSLLQCVVFLRCGFCGQLGLLQPQCRQCFGKAWSSPLDTGKAISPSEVKNCFPERLGLQHGLGISTSLVEKDFQSAP